MNLLSNVEIMLLQIIYQYEKITGYDINKYVISLKYRDWADIGKTSIYTGLKKLEKKELVISFIDLEKKGKGPLPRRYSITHTGSEILKQEMNDILMRSREREKRFDLVISGIQILDTSEIVLAFEKRIEYLQLEFKRISQESVEQNNCIPLGGKILYMHILGSINSEIKYSKSIIKYFDGI